MKSLDPRLRGDDAIKQPPEHDMAALVTTRGLTKTYQRGPEKVEVLHGIDLDIPKGDFVALRGPSGSGQTTLLNLIGGLDTPTAGEIEIEGERLDRMSG